MGKSTIPMAVFNSYVAVYQKVVPKAVPYRRSCPTPARPRTSKTEMGVTAGPWSIAMTSNGNADTSHK